MNTVSFKPLGTRILIKPLPVESKTASGIFIPENAKEKPSQGEVVAVGPGNERMQTSVGDQVLYPQHGGVEIKLEGISYILIKEEDVYGIL
jgi:chaperonin GroES